MSIVACPGCNKNVSSRIKLCQHCGYQRGEVTEEELNEFRRRKLRDRIYHLKMTSYVALSLLIAASGWYLQDTQGLQHQSSMGPYILFAAGAVCYLVTRVYLYKCKMALRKLRF